MLPGTQDLDLALAHARLGWEGSTVREGGRVLQGPSKGTKTCLYLRAGERNTT